MLLIVPSTGGFERNPYFTQVLIIRTKNPKQENRVYSSMAFLRTEK
jgi:hypothetical protein